MTSIEPARLARRNPCHAQAVGERSAGHVDSQRAALARASTACHDVRAGKADPGTRSRRAIGQAAEAGRRAHVRAAAGQPGDRDVRVHASTPRPRPFPEQLRAPRPARAARRGACGRRRCACRGRPSHPRPARRARAPRSGSAGCPSRRGSTARLRSRRGPSAISGARSVRRSAAAASRLSLAGWASDATPPA